MTDPDEAEAAIAAAASKVRLLLNGETPTNATVAREVVRAYLQALPGWRLVPVEPTEAQKSTHAMEAIFDSEWSLLVELAPPPPGLEPDSHE